MFHILLLLFFRTKTPSENNQKLYAIFFNCQTYFPFFFFYFGEQKTAFKNNYQAGRNTLALMVGRWWKKNDTSIHSLVVTLRLRSYIKLPFVLPTLLHWDDASKQTNYNPTLPSSHTSHQSDSHHHWDLSLSYTYLFFPQIQSFNRHWL